MENVHKTKRRKRISKYKKRKICFWIILCGLLIFGTVFYLMVDRVETPHRLIRVGICGAINRPAVYTMREGSDLSMLVVMAHGFTHNAEIKRVNLDRIIYNDSIYHIPASGTADNSKILSLIISSAIIFPEKIILRLSISTRHFPTTLNVSRKSRGK